MKENSAALDLLPTLADLTGIEAKTAKLLDGTSLAPFLRGEKSPNWKPRMLFSYWKGRSTAKYLNFRMGTKGGLFDLDADPGQRKNVAEEHAETTAMMGKALAKFNAEIVAELPKIDTRPFVVGHPDSPNTQIPARDGTAHGGIKRSNKFPNCSYFHSWTSTDDKITWAVEVGKTGDYEVEIHYACAAKNVGSTIELNYGDTKISNKITKAHDPPLRGEENDRSPRQSSYVKDFKPMKFGTIHLKKGKGTLTLQANEIPGKEAMEFRLMMLQRK